MNLGPITKEMAEVIRLSPLEVCKMILNLCGVFYKRFLFIGGKLNWNSSLFQFYDLTGVSYSKSFALDRAYSICLVKT